MTDAPIASEGASAPGPVASRVYRTELNPVDFLRRAAYVYPDKLAMVDGARRYCYGELAERAWRLANALRSAGMRKGDRVATLLFNSSPMLEALFGVPAAGGILVAINSRLASPEVGYILEHSGARFLVLDAELEALVVPLALPNVTVIRCHSDSVLGRCALGCRPDARRGKGALAGDCIHDLAAHLSDDACGGDDAIVPTWLHVTENRGAQRGRRNRPIADAEPVRTLRGRGRADRPPGLISAVGTSPARSCAPHHGQAKAIVRVACADARVARRARSAAAGHPTSPNPAHRPQRVRALRTRSELPEKRTSPGQGVPGQGPP